MGASLSTSPERIPDVWRACRLRHDVPTLATGHANLDRHLPGRGWPLGVISELLFESPGAGEFSLLLPALATVSARGQWVVLIDPPWIPYPPAMRGHGVALERVLLVRTRTASDSLWACEQALRGVPGGAVLAWPANPGFTRLRRLQLAAKAGRKLAFVFRPAAALAQASPAALRLQVTAAASGSRVRVLKCRGRLPEQSLLIRRGRHLPGMAALAATAERDDQFPLRLPADARAAPVEAHVHPA
jgi:hypothetical protein